MRKVLHTLVLSTLLLAPASAAYAQANVGIRIGPPPSAHVYRVAPSPGPGYQWIEGYQYPQGNHYKWHNGYWTRPPYDGAYWVPPYYANGEYFNGRWEGHHDVNHNHHWDQSKQRDGGRYTPHPNDR